MSKRAAWARRGLRASYVLGMIRERVTDGVPFQAPDALAILTVAVNGTTRPSELAAITGSTERVARERLDRLARWGWLRTVEIDGHTHYAPLGVLEQRAAAAVRDTG